MSKPKRMRIIDELRRMFPGTWRYEPKNWPPYRGEKFNVYAEASIVNADLDQFCTQCRRDDTRELVPILGHSGRTGFGQ